MPKLFEWDGYKFFFFSNEGAPLERRHVHVRKGTNIAKFWMDPEIALESSVGFNSRELNVLERIVKECSDEIRKKWDEYFNT